jgi:uncharacterized protein YjaG (DUF416 family)
MLRFDEAELVQNLERLSIWQRVAFAVACAERLRPAYLSFSERTGRGNSLDFEDALDRLWLDLGGETMTDDEVGAKIERCMELMPREGDEPWDDSQVYAENAGSALVYALRCRQNGQSQEAAWAARHVYEALDHHIIARESMDVSAPGAEARVLSHPLIQAELCRQRRDLERSLGIHEDVRQTIVVLRDQARREAGRVFSGPS